MKRQKKYRLIKTISAILLIITLLVIGFRFSVILNPPKINEKQTQHLTKKQIADNIVRVDDSWLKKNKYGLWEMMIAGKPYERGYKVGLLSRDLIRYQEHAFVEFLKNIVPSDNYLNFLKYFIAWFNKNIDKHIPIEYQEEIFGISQFASEEFNFIAPNYHRILNYHGAHDIGHTLQNLNLVGCTAFGVKGKASEDSSILVGRNMDFYSGDKFAENKIVAFYKPEEGYNFAFITWGGMIGVLSGMNDQGLTISLNAAKSSIPLAAKTPVSILARTILQYASTIDEAFQIAQKYETFVAESFFISSAKNYQMAIIEKSTTATNLYTQPNDVLILTNHFQSDSLKRTEVVKQPHSEHPSLYRWDRTNELLKKYTTHNPTTFAQILRNQKGLANKNIGMGNEKAINQLISHHSVIFKPQTRQMWVATPPYQLGDYIVYNLDSIFHHSNPQKVLYDTLLTIKQDSFLNSPDYQSFLKYKKAISNYKKILKDTGNRKIDLSELNNFTKYNSEYYYTYLLAGEIFEAVGKLTKALENYQKALSKEIPHKDDRVKIQKKIEEIKRKI